MEALRVQRRENGRVTGLLTRGDSPVGGASGPNSSFGFAARDDASRAARSGPQFPPAFAVAGSGLPDVAGLAHAIAVVKAAAAAAPDILALADYAEAADFAAQAEDLSRTVEYVQILGAGAVDRTRAQAIADAAAGRTNSGRAWITGWDTGTGTATDAHTETVAETPSAWPHGTADPVMVGEAGFTAQAVQSDAPGTPGSPAAAGRSAASGRSAAAVPASPADDGCKNTAEFLRARLRISVAEAHRRISLAAAVLPRPGISGHTQPPERPELSTALAAGTVASRPATIITLALERVRHHATEDTTARMEHALTRTAAENDTDFLTRIARRWTEAIDQDGTEPTEHELRQRQGAFLRPARRGLNHLEIFATPDQYEHLLTVMNTATNPRIHPTTGTGEAGPGDAGGEETANAGAGEAGAPEVELDRRTRPQQLLDGLVGACKAALATGTLPAAGGLRPQVMVTIDYRDLLDRLEHATAQGPRYRSRATGTTTYPGTRIPNTVSIPGAGSDADSGSEPGTRIPNTVSIPGAGSDADSGSEPGTRTPDSGRIPGTGSDSDSGPGRIAGTGSFAFTGPVTASTVRKIACDADIIPVLLGSEGRILDIGRTTRIFPPHIRKAITARDQGCAFPGCTIPAPWCEAHHITYWSHGGSTSTENGTLLCSHHHHLIHKEQWQIQIKTGIPWFIPPPHIDPHQKPQRNHHQT